MTVIAHGESGHTHAIMEDVTVLENDGVKTIKASAPYTCVHEEHGPVTINPETKGDVTVGFVQEFDHAAEESQRVMD